MAGILVVINFKSVNKRTTNTAIREIILIHKEKLPDKKIKILIISYNYGRIERKKIK